MWASEEEKRQKGKVKGKRGKGNIKYRQEKERN
jgi:hypothetical protein